MCGNFHTTLGYTRWYTRWSLPPRLTLPLDEDTHERLLIRQRPPQRAWKLEDVERAEGVADGEHLLLGLGRGKAWKTRRRTEKNREERESDGEKCVSVMYKWVDR